MAQDMKKSEVSAAPARRHVEPFSLLRDEMDRVFDSFLGRGFGRLAQFPRMTGWGDNIVPSVDAHEDEKQITVEAELPGIDEKDVSLTLNDGILTIKGEKKSDREEKNGDYHLTERSYGSFVRSLALGDGVDPDKVTATFDKGVLKVTLPKRPEVVKAEKRIPIAKA